MNSHIIESEVWKYAYFPEEVTDEIRMKFNQWYYYEVRFDGTKAIQMTKFKEI